MGKRIGEKAIKATIAVVGLLVLRLILSALPMLKHPVIYAPSTSAQISLRQLLGSSAMQTLQQEFGSLTPAQRNAMGQAFSGIQRGQDGGIENGFDQLFSANAAAANLWAKGMMQAHVVIFPITIANAMVDTLIFIVLLLFGRDVGAIISMGSTKMPEMGSILYFAVIAAVVALAYGAYQGILYPFLLPNHTDIYGWVFLAAGLAPLVWIGVLVSRNMDAITAAVMHAGSRSLAVAGTAVGTAQGSPACPNCGHAVRPGAKFCSHCAAPLSGGVGRRFCSSCGAENSTTSKFCGGCGQALTD
jgi:hypothetical protein